MTNDFEADIAAVQQIGAVSTILDVVCRITGTRFAAIARVTEDRWIACSVKDDIPFGLKVGDELPIATTFCNQIRQHRQPVIFDDVTEDETYRGHPIPAMYGIRSYISLPIVLPDGTFFGTLCALDTEPARLKSPEIIGMFKLFAELVGFHLDAIDRLAKNQAALLEERKQAKLHEQFIAILGHDLRNPLAAIDAEASTLLRAGLDASASEIAKEIKYSVRRTLRLITDLLEFTRRRLGGGGLPLNRDAREPLKPLLDQVIAESRMIFPGRAVEAEFRLDEPINCDRARVAQLLSNLVSNALTYGAEDGPVQIRGFTAGGIFELSVSNSGDPIPAAEIPGLFHPFTRGEVRPDQYGLGLGLYIASEIARAHAGTLTASSSSEETRFTFRMPVAERGLQPVE
jgi:signal transduction histidine kinase